MLAELLGAAAVGRNPARPVSHAALLAFAIGRRLWRTLAVRRAALALAVRVTGLWWLIEVRRLLCAVRILRRAPAARVLPRVLRRLRHKVKIAHLGTGKQPSPSNGCRLTEICQPAG